MSIRESTATFQLLNVVSDPRRPQVGIQCDGCGWSVIDAKSLAAEVVLLGIAHRCPSDDPWGAEAARLVEPTGAAT